MKRTAVRLLTATLVAASAGIAFLPVARAAEAGLTPALEGWYQPNPTCAQASGCLTTGSLPVAPPAAVPTNPYPDGSLHVGYASQAETARAYLSFSFAGLTGTLTGAQLDIPLDVDPANGDAQSSTAKIQACLVTGVVSKQNGSLETPPAVSCEAHADVTYVATPTPHLHADLAPLLVGLVTTNGIALLPDATKEADAPSDAWRVVFSAHDRADAAKTAPARLTLTVTDEAVISTPEQPAVQLPPPPVVAPITGGFVPAPATDFVSSPSVSVPVPAAVPDVAAPAVQPVPVAQTVTFGYAYPAVWLLPLGLLVLVPLATRALTKDLAPV